VYGENSKEVKKIDTYRRNLQRAHVDRLAYIINAKNQSKRLGSDYVKSTAVNTSQSDIRAVTRFELNELKRMIKRGLIRSADGMTRIHLQDIAKRIEAVLNPE
jgi:hypothetical protein